MRHTYVIVGGGLAAASAVEGIREHDREGGILLVSRENFGPYHRPPLSKDLWFGKSTLDKLPVHDEAWYRENNVALELRREVVELDPARHLLWDERGAEIEYEKLLIATGGRPRRLTVDGAEVEGLRYFRELEDYLALQRRLDHFEHVLVIGGGFIGAELAAALRHAGKEVTYVIDREYPLARVLPRDLGLFVADYYRQQGIETVSEDKVVGLEESQGLIQARTANGGVITTQLVVAGLGIEPEWGLAEAAGLDVDDGVVVDEFARTTDPDIYAAGDVARFPCVPLERSLRVEHWDHARQHGRCAGANMAGAVEPYEGIPYFFSDLFDLGFEAVGDLDPTLRIEAVWRQPFREGVVFYLRDDVVRGVLLWNVWGAVEWARSLVRAAKPMTSEEREAAIPTGE
ncbi:MAG TPA: FAD/NAD(P)-binding oxidoreductase [Terriglobales bacterium]|nr:FAD/NAD(P)-binding oxidoreductase [Terriglobales bacterium]